jgi:hypothetical protein
MLPAFTFDVECKVNKHDVAVWIVKDGSDILFFEDGNLWDGTGKTFRGIITNGRSRKNSSATF